jgi:hypothetical protein
MHQAYGLIVCPVLRKMELPPAFQFVEAAHPDRAALFAAIAFRRSALI